MTTDTVNYGPAGTAEALQAAHEAMVARGVRVILKTVVIEGREPFTSLGIYIDQNRVFAGGVTQFTCEEALRSLDQVEAQIVR